MKRALLFITGLFTGLQICAQENIPIGTWRTHFSYYNVLHIADAGSRIYASAESGLFFYDKNDHSITKVSTVDGLQDVNISALYYDLSHNQLLIAYQSGNLDVIRGQEIFNLDLTATAQVSGSKRINHIAAHEDYAYLSTDYGVLQFDLESLQVRETYRELGWGANRLHVNQAAVFNDSLFLATAEGVLAAGLRGNVNLLDYRNWRRFNLGEAISESHVAIIATLDDKLVAGINNDSLYLYTGRWESINMLAGEVYDAASASGEDLLLVHNNRLTRISSTLQAIPVRDPLITKVNEAIADAEGRLWVADGNNGLLSGVQGSFQSFAPSGPYKNMVFRLTVQGNAIYALPGGFTSGVAPPGSDAGFYVYSNGTWENYNVSNAGTPEFKDITDAGHSGGSLFLASAGYGLLQIMEDGKRIVIDEDTSPLQNLSTTAREVLVPAIAAGNGGLWVLNYGAGKPLHFLETDGTWHSYGFNPDVAQYAVDLLPVNDLIWMIIDPARGGGLVVFDPANGTSRYLTEIADNGGLASDHVNALALDRKGLLWVGTDQGVSVFSNPSGVMQGSVNATEPYFGNRKLLSDEKVRAIAVDGGNRKWMGTTNGVWLFNDAADEEILNFTTENSPLPDDEVRDIAINGITGEVFFATAEGIASYRGTATASAEVHGNVKIFPNPITLDFQGTVGISGLATDAIVKITDISGKLVWQAQASGGTAIWPVADFKGDRPATGIYLVFSATPAGEDTFIGKIAIVN